MRPPRNSGIDLLRLLAMCFVVLLHSLGQGGVLAAVQENSAQYVTAWALEIIAFSAVDIFALISGYVNYREQEDGFHPDAWFRLWLEVVFYILAVNVIFSLFTKVPVSFWDYLCGLLPVTNGTYWYFTAYTGLFVLMPLLDRGLRRLDRSTARKLFLLMILAFSLYNTFAHSFAVSKGHSFVWIVLLYILGAILKKCEIGKRWKSRWLVLLLVLLNAVALLNMLYGQAHAGFGMRLKNDSLIYSSSPTVLVSALIWVILFARMKLPEWRLLRLAAPSAFAVYLLNTHKLIWNHVIQGLFAELAGRRWYVMALCLLVFACLFTLAAVLVDRLRIWLFRLAGVQKRTQWMAGKISKVLEKISNRL